ncbi:MAG TPA: glycosyltransferase 87 family protein [Candidatus Limnocylindria bacterium]|nr:glycosyltransferase 87 family protein [Candidatus Limnocylindria bacterium]
MQKVAAHGAFAVVAIAFVIVAAALARHGVVQHQSFKAFYCAGEAVRERRDPYRVEPLRSCERRVAAIDAPEGYVEPAPLPGYALVPFAALAALPVRTAALLFAVLLALASVAAAWFLAAALRAPPAAVLLAFAPLAFLNAAYGEIPPFAVLGICAAAYCLRTERWNLAGIVVCGALLQPNVGVPAALACLICVPRARRALVATTLVLAGISLAVLGVAGNAEYFGAVLPLQAGAELAASDQYSLARLLVVAGVAPDASLLVAKLAFAVMVAVGVVLAGVIAVRLRSPEAVPLIPPAAVLLGGIYVHDIQMLFALPAALFVAARLRGPLAETLGITALALLIAVWTQRAARAVLVLDALGVAAGVLAVASRADRVRALARAATAAVAVTACVIVFQRAAPPVPTSQIVTAPFGASADELAPAAWARYLQATPALRRPELVLKLPTWFGLVLLLLASLQLGLARRSDEGGEELTPARSARREPPLASAS